MALNINALLNQVLFNYVTCNYSTNVAVKVSTVADIAIDANWYNFPVADQKLFPFVIQRSQKQIRLSGYDIFTCSRETFLTVRLWKRNQYICIKSIKSLNKFTFGITVFEVSRIILPCLSSTQLDLIYRRAFFFGTKSSPKKIENNKAASPR